MAVTYYNYLPAYDAGKNILAYIYIKYLDIVVIAYPGIRLQMHPVAYLYLRQKFGPLSVDKLFQACLNYKRARVSITLRNKILLKAAPAPNFTYSGGNLDAILL